MIKQSYLFSFAVMLVIMLANLSVPSHAASLGDGNQIPHIGDAGRADYLKFASAPLPRAFAIAPGGVWAWVSGGDTKELTELDALNSCRQYTEQTCQLYAVDDQVVFDETQWTSSWRLHLDGNAVANAPVGIGRAQRFPDLALTSPNNRPIMLSDLRGKPVFLHFGVAGVRHAKPNLQTCKNFITPLRMMTLSHLFWCRAENQLKSRSAGWKNASL